MMNANNPFGMKARKDDPYVVRHTREWISQTAKHPGYYLVIEARFRKFATLTDAFIAHGQLLMDPKGPYAKALVVKHDSEAYIKVIGPTYATDPDYFDKLLSIVRINKLTQFDKLTPQSLSSSAPTLSA